MGKVMKVEDKQLTTSQTVALNVKLLAELRGIPIYDIEKAVGLSRGYIARCNGAKYLSVDKVVLLAKYFDVSLEDLCGASILEQFAKKLGYTLVLIDNQEQEE